MNAFLASLLVAVLDDIPGQYWEFVVPGYVIAIGSIALYGRWVVQRGKKLSAKVPVEKRRFFGE
jgi:hypothetical protein